MSGERALHPVTRPASEVVVWSCGLTRLQRSYVVDGLRRRAACHFIDTFEEVETCLGAAAPCDALIVAPHDTRGRDALPVVQRIAREWPDVAIVIFYPARSDAPVSPKAMALAGAHEFVFEGVYDTAALLAQAVDNARRGCAAETVFAALQPVIPAQLHAMVHAVVARPESLTGVEEVAAAIGVHRKTLVNHCARCGYLQPGEVIVWCRLALVAHMLERTGSTVESIALTLGFASHTALRNLIKRYTGRRATDIRRDGGLAVVIEALIARAEGRRPDDLAHTVTIASVATHQRGVDSTLGGGGEGDIGHVGGPRH